MCQLSLGALCACAHPALLVEASQVPDGQHVTTFVVSYADGSVDQLELVVGVDTADSFYDYTGDCQKHTRIKPAYTYEHMDASAVRRYRHFFYSSLSLDPARVVAAFSLKLDDSACAWEGDCQAEGSEKLRVVVHSVTFENPQGFGAMPLLSPPAEATTVRGTHV